jgi:hypothetical protein
LTADLPRIEAHFWSLDFLVQLAEQNIGQFGQAATPSGGPAS